ncbi:nucleolar complex protein 3 [Apis mellifera carnica]|uniref:NOC3-like protein n=1 Tax=Apis mellifera TaxID=7460 RepID=A0A7M7GQI0_APIME|nr:nucleolar complex protein 3 homolog [Apis mellifera]KAG9428257.1 nucleolar complex protein 3 [Apis mellifera carnica]|eukprot:XP_006563442.2 nucleolar complex protein 3 homolog [Apis mellifera]
MAKKLKISIIKRSNQKRTKLAHQGKLKIRRHKLVKKPIQKQIFSHTESIEEEESDHDEDLIDMVEKEDLDFLQEAISNNSYNLLKQLHLNEVINNKKNNKNKNKKKQTIEERYENNISKVIDQEGSKKVRMLLPIKTKNGIIEKRLIQESDIEDNENTSEKEHDEDNVEIESNLHNKNKDENKTSISIIELLAYRKEILTSKRLKIGLLSSNLLETPETKCENFKALLELMEETNPEVYITVRKLATVSLMEVFKDLLPSYQILQIPQEGVKLKKETLALQNYETILLRYYKYYLQKLEKMINILKKKKGDTRKIKDQQIELGKVAVTCMCDLLIMHPYFNYSINIANFLIPLLDNKYEFIRQKVLKCLSQIFKEDKRVELSLIIVRKLNQYIKLKAHSVHSEVLSVLLFLRIKDINLDKEKEENTKQKKLVSYKQRILALSKKERKKNKKLEQIERELLETKAEENKQTKQKLLAEITNIVFTIYFRILKQAPNSKILSICLEGLAKFAHCINLDFYQDLVTTIDKLMEENNLSLKDQLYCIQCIFTILSGQGLQLNLDPYRFYAHLYKNLLNIHCGKTYSETEIIIKILVQTLIHRRKRITQRRLIAFIKRIAILTLQLQHNAVLGILGIIKQNIQLGKELDILLDTDCTIGDGFYQAELEEPEYCNAHCSALWELAALQRHYHSIVQKMAKNIAWNVPSIGEGSLSSEIAKLSPEELHIEFDPTGVVFKPAVPVPRKTSIKKTVTTYHFMNSEFKEYINTINNTELFANGYIDFYKACNN